MALHNTTFTPLTSGTRDSSAEKGAVYYLDGNPTNGRLNINETATWKVGNNTHVIYDGNSGYSFMNGIIQSENLTYIAKPNGGNRADFFSPKGGNQGKNTNLMFLGSGSVFCHLESTRNQFSGFLKLIFDMASGTSYVQFANREYSSITLDVQSSHAAQLNLYPSRDHPGFSSLPGFRTMGLNANQTLILLKGGQSTSHGRIYDPVYEGVANNLLPLRRSGGSSSNDHKEYFTIDVTAIAHDESKIYVTDAGGSTQHNRLLTNNNATVYANDGTTPLVFYSGKKVIPCLVRTISTSTSTSRNTINYLIRHLGNQEIKADQLIMNAPIVLKETIKDLYFSNTYNAATTTITGIAFDRVAKKITLSATFNLDQFYDAIKWWLYQDGQMSLKDFVTTGNEKINLSDWNLTVGTNGVLNGGVKLKTVATTGNITTLESGQMNLAFTDANQNATVTVKGLPNGANIVVRNQTNTTTLKTGTTPFTYGYNANTQNHITIKASFIQGGIQKTSSIQYQLKTGTNNEVILSVGELQTINTEVFVEQLKQEVGSGGGRSGIQF